MGLNKAIKKIASFNKTQKLEEKFAKIGSLLEKRKFKKIAQMVTEEETRLLSSLFEAAQRRIRKEHPEYSTHECKDKAMRELSVSFRDPVKLHALLARIKEDETIMPEVDRKMQMAKIRREKGPAKEFKIKSIFSDEPDDREPENEELLEFKSIL